MSDSKLRDLTADTAPTSDDLVYLLNSPGAAPNDRKVTLDDLATALAAMTGFSATYAPLAGSGASLQATRFYMPSSAAASTTAGVQNQGMYAPIVIERAGTIVSLTCEVTTGQSGASTDLGIWLDDDDAPGALVGGTTGQDATTNAVKTTSGLSIAIPSAGKYWVGAIPRGATPATYRAYVPTAIIGRQSISTGTAPRSHLSSATPVGLPDPPTISFYGGTGAPFVIVLEVD